MCDTLSEMLLKKGLQDITMLDLLHLPVEQDYIVKNYLEKLLSVAINEDEADEEGGLAATDAICTELERLWDEGISLTVESADEVDLGNFWRMLVILPALFFHGEDLGDDDEAGEDDGVVVSHDTIIRALQVGFNLWHQNGDFEAVLMAMPEGICYDFLMDLDDEERLQCLMRLTLADEGWLFQMDEEMVRDILVNGGSVVRNSMIQLLKGLGVEITLDKGAPCDPAWVEACDCPDCMDGTCRCNGCCWMDEDEGE